MTTITEPSTAAVPRWLNVDALCPPEVREEVAVLTAAFGTYLYEMEEDLRQARHLLATLDALSTAAAWHRLDTHELMMAVSGGEELWTAMARLSEALDPELIDKPLPTHGEEVTV